MMTSRKQDCFPRPLLYEYHSVESLQKPKRARGKIQQKMRPAVKRSELRAYMKVPWYVLTVDGLHRTRDFVCIPAAAGLNLRCTADRRAVAEWSLAGGSFDADRHAQEHDGAGPDRGYCAAPVGGGA